MLMKSVTAFPFPRITLFTLLGQASLEIWKRLRGWAVCKQMFIFMAYKHAGWQFDNPCSLGWKTANNSGVLF